MADTTDYTKVDVLIIGAGPAGLAAALTIKKSRPALDVVVIDKAAEPGHHNLSGAVLEPGQLHKLLDHVLTDWSKNEQAQKILSTRVERDDTLFLPCPKAAVNISFAIRMAKSLGLGFGQMVHKGDYICSVSRLTAWLAQIAKDLGVEVLTGFAAGDIILDGLTAVKLVDQGLDKHGNKQPNYLPGELIKASVVVLAEGCDGLVTEKFITKANLMRQGRQLYSLGVRELIKVSGEQYKNFGPSRVVHAMGWPIWRPVIGPGMFGGGIMYAMGDDTIAVGMIVGLDWKYHDFNAQDALTLFKEHRFVKRFIEGGKVIEAGAKMIPEGGFYALPRDPAAGSIGKGNVLILGDSAGFVNMLKIKGLHNAIASGTEAGLAIAGNFEQPLALARVYTQRLVNCGLIREMESARNFRQTVAQFGPLQGMPLSVLGGLLPKFNIEPDYEAMTTARYRLKPDVNFDKDTFTALAVTSHRDEQPCHLQILDPAVCRDKCAEKFGRPCITFCPAGVYETIQSELKAANPSNCLHCKTCQRKCPFDNIRWTAPEGSGGPKYKNM